MFVTKHGSATYVQTRLIHCWQKQIAIVLLNAIKLLGLYGRRESISVKAAIKEQDEIGRLKICIRTTSTYIPSGSD